MQSFLALGKVAKKSLAYMWLFRVVDNINLNMGFYNVGITQETQDHTSHVTPIKDKKKTFFNVTRLLLKMRPLHQPSVESSAY